MLFMIGGAPRTGKTILAQRMAAKLQIGWVPTDLLSALVRLQDETRTNPEIDLTPRFAAKNAEWFFPYLERFARGMNYYAASYIIEGVAFLPEHVMQLSSQVEVQPVFLGCSKMTLERFDQFPGHSRGYAALPEDVRLSFVEAVPIWSTFVEQESHRFGYPYVDMVGDFPSCLDEAESILISG